MTLSALVVEGAGLVLSGETFVTLAEERLEALTGDAEFSQG